MCKDRLFIAHKQIICAVFICIRQQTCCQRKTSYANRHDFRLHDVSHHAATTTGCFKKPSRHDIMDFPNALTMRYSDNYQANPQKTKRNVCKPNIRKVNSLHANGHAVCNETRLIGSQKTVFYTTKSHLSASCRRSFTTILAAFSMGTNSQLFLKRTHIATFRKRHRRHNNLLQVSQLCSLAVFQDIFQLTLCNVYKAFCDIPSNLKT